MEYKDIYSLDDKDLRGSFVAISKNDLDDYKLFRGEIQIHLNNKLVFYNNYGKKTYDIISSGFAGLYLFSDKIINILIDNKINGWKNYPCLLYDRNLNEIKGYSIFAVTGRCGSIDYNKSEKIIIQPYSSSGKPVDAIKGLFFEKETWDNSDIFTPLNTKYTFITSKVKEILENNKVSNIKFEKITEIEIV